MKIVHQKGIVHVRSGDEVIPVKRPNPGVTVRNLNACFYHDFSPVLAARHIEADGLMAWWKQRLSDKVMTWRATRPGQHRLVRPGFLESTHHVR